MQKHFSLFPWLRGKTFSKDTDSYSSHIIRCHRILVYSIAYGVAKMAGLANHVPWVLVIVSTSYRRPLRILLHTHITVAYRTNDTGWKVLLMKFYH